MSIRTIRDRLEKLEELTNIAPVWLLSYPQKMDL